jgi:DNA-directed RNA polymerase sigma subunit (sigma70/sigma32)
MNDVLNGMRVLKLYAWEESMEKLISKLRERELKVLRQLFLLDAGINVSFQLAPLIVCLYF